MPDKQALRKEFESIRDRYQTLFSKLVELGTPGVINPVASQCDTGEWCCTGTEKVKTVVLDEPFTGER